MVQATNLGFPRIGAYRELKRAVESFWKEELTEADLVERGRRLRQANWARQADAGLDVVPVGDFAFYDHVLETALMFGAVPPRFQGEADAGRRSRLFAMARGKPGSVAPLEMTKWFDTNYHYLVPELQADQTFGLDHNDLADQVREARAFGLNARPVILGPLSLLHLAKPCGDSFDLLSLLDTLLPAYRSLLAELAATGCDWVQIDEPILVLELSDAWRGAYQVAYQALGDCSEGLRILLTTYFGPLGDNLETVFALPVDGLHLDVVRGRSDLDRVANGLPDSWFLSLGLVDGRNVWKNDLNASLELAEGVADQIGRDRLWLAPSCSLIHCPVDLDLEQNLDPELRDWLSFAQQKLGEVAVLARALNDGRDSVADTLQSNAAALEARRSSAATENDEVRRRLAGITPKMIRRQSEFSVRQVRQQESLGLPLFPTTTIGSFPQTQQIRRTRAGYRTGSISAEDYVSRMRESITDAIRIQEEIGLDVLVHGEPERNDMVEYFGEHLDGVACTEHGWVQSYGTRCVKPPLIFGDVQRPQAMTVSWYQYAQSLTKRPVKGMLTGPVTILNWSFPRDDRPRAEICRQLALAIRDEVADLERAGCRIIQIDEPALREGLPLRSTDQPAYLDWSVKAFRLASCGVEDATQIHTHMCYCEFNDIIQTIAGLDADVVSIEASRSKMELLRAFTDFEYPNGIGPGVYDIHSPRVPHAAEIGDLIVAACQSLPRERLWINPDCGLKTRRWEEVKPALTAMVEAARMVRERL